MGGLTLEDRLAHDPVIDGICLTAVQRLFHIHVYGDAILGVHADRRPVLRCLLHGPHDLAVVGVEDPRVGHEHLEAGHAFSNQKLHLLEGLVVDVAGDHVESVIDGAVAPRLLHPRLPAVHGRLADGLHREVDDGGRSAPGRSPSPGLEGVSGEGATERQFHVGVDVDPAGDHQLPGGVDDLIRLDRVLTPE